MNRRGICARRCGVYLEERSQGWKLVFPFHTSHSPSFRSASFLSVNGNAALRAESEGPALRSHQVECNPCFLRKCPWIFTACTPSLLKKLQMPFWSSSKDGVKFWRQKCSRYSAAGFHFAAGDMSVDFTPVCKCPPFATADSCFLIPYCAQDRAWNACRETSSRIEAIEKGIPGAAARTMFLTQSLPPPKTAKTQKRISYIR